MPQLKQPKLGKSRIFPQLSALLLHRSPNRSCSKQAVIHPGSLSSGTRDIPMLPQESQLHRHGEDHFRQPDFAGTTSEQHILQVKQVLLPVHKAQQQPPADCAKLCKNMRGQDSPVLFKAAISHCQPLVHTEGSVNGLRIDMFRGVKECKNWVERTCDDQYFGWVDKPKLGGFLSRMENYHKTVQQKHFGQV